jgi:serine/threonine protein kinase
VEVLQRRAGDITRHSRRTLHGVTKLNSGTRYSLFVVDRNNALGDNCVIEATPELVEDVLAKIKHDATAASLTYHVSIPFNEITIGEQIGAGASKTVYAAMWVGSISPQSVCVAHHHTNASLTLTATELDIIRAIGKHPNLARFYGCCVHVERTYFVMERAPFGSLREYLLSVEDSGPLKPVIAMEIALQVCRAMQQLTALSVIHRDLAARNVLVFAVSGRSHHDVLVKVSDFGLSRQAPTASDYYYGDAGRLPTRWCSPEVLQRRKYSEKSDAWAFGVTFWEVLTLAMVPYYECTADEQVVRAIVAGTKLAAPAGYPAAVFERCVLPCLATAANDRPDFTRLLQALRVVQEELLIQEATENPARAERMCCICLTSRSCYAIIPCGHQCLCDGAGCTAAFQPPHRAHCPICRTPVTSLLHVFA